MGSSRLADTRFRCGVDLFGEVGRGAASVRLGKGRTRMAWVAQDYKFAFAKKLRSNPTRHEEKVWKALRKGSRGFRFCRQIVIRGYIVDFYCHKARLAVELDGKSHDTKRDSARDAHLEQSGVAVLRFKNPRTQVDVTNILFRVTAECRHRANRDFSTFAQHSSFQQQVKNREEKAWGKPDLSRGCQRQGFASIEIATTFAQRFGGKPDPCSDCKLVHVSE
jgi:very-short-patch-repair endonuclease